ARAANSASPSPRGGGSLAKRSEGERGGVNLVIPLFTPPRLASRFARCIADPPPPGEGDGASGRSRVSHRNSLDRMAGTDEKAPSGRLPDGWHRGSMTATKSGGSAMAKTSAK